MLNALATYELATAQKSAERIEIICSQIEELETSIQSNPFIAVSQTLRFLLKSFCLLCSWSNQMMQGDVNAHHTLTAAKLQMEASLPALEKAQPFAIFVHSVTVTQQLISQISSPRDVDQVAIQLTKIPLPFGYLATNPIWNSWDVYGNYLSVEAVETQKNLPLIVKIMFELDNRPWNTPQIVRSGVIYSLKAVVSIPQWPDGYDRLQIDYVSTLPPNTFSLTSFTIEKSDVREYEKHGHAHFPQAQSLASQATDIQVRASFFNSENGGHPLSVSIIGYHQLQVKAVETIPNLSGYPTIDEQNYEIWEKVRQLPGVAHKHAQDFIEALGAATNYMNLNLQQGLYQEGMKISEADFQQDLLKHMRLRLGSDVEEAPNAAGGIKDIQYRTVTVELKVEKKIKDRKKMIEKYLAQITQYTSASGSQLGILCILDLTPKMYPVANPKNNVLLETPRLHGFTEDDIKFPTRIAVVIIEGNLRLPSSLQ